jgi:hypothetical protein
MTDTPTGTRVVRTRKPAQDRQAKAPTKAQAAATAAAARVIDIEDDEEPITVNLVGKQYIAHKPKSMLAIRLGERINVADFSTDNLGAVREAMGEFCVLMFGTETASDIMARLEDPDDRLDLPHIQRLVNRMVEVTTGRPPTS